jgi:hypothetical protein
MTAKASPNKILFISPSDQAEPLAIMLLDGSSECVLAHAVRGKIWPASPQGWYDAQLLNNIDPRSSRSSDPGLCHARAVGVSELMLVSMPSAAVRAVADFYRGRTVNLVVGYGPGVGHG